MKKYTIMMPVDIEVYTPAGSEDMAIGSVTMPSHEMALRFYRIHLAQELTANVALAQENAHLRRELALLREKI